MPALLSRRRFCSLIVMGLAVLPAAPAAAGIGQLPGTGGCVVAQGRGCAVDPLLRGVRDVAVSPDGRTVYATAAGTDALVVLTRDRRTGVLRRRACFSRTGTRGCRNVPGLDGPGAIAVAPGGRDVYLAAHGSRRLLHLRAPAGGAFVDAGCVGADAASGCAGVHPLLAEVDDLRVADAGRVLIATAEGGTVVGEGEQQAGVVSLRRDGPSGSLTPAGCLAVIGTTGCPGGDVLPGAPSGAVAVAPGGRVLYVPGTRQVTRAVVDAGDGHLTVTRCLAQQRRPGCTRVPHLGTSGEDDGTLVAALSTDGRHLTTAGWDGRIPVDPVALLTHAVKGTTGALGRMTCVAISVDEEVRARAPGCGRGRPPLNGPELLLPSPDGQHMLAVDQVYDLVSVLRRSPGSGALTRVLGRTGCIGGADAAFGNGALRYPHRSCAVGRRIHDVNAATWSPDGAHVYLACANGIVVLRVR